jgi:hypothetical protein
MVGARETFPTTLARENYDWLLNFGWIQERLPVKAGERHKARAPKVDLQMSRLRSMLPIALLQPVSSSAMFR